MKGRTNIPIRNVKQSDVEAWIRKRLGELVGLDAEQIDGQADFESLGVDSAQAVSLLMDVEDWLGMDQELPLDVVFEEPNIAETARTIAEIANGTRSGSDGAERDA